MDILLNFVVKTSKNEEKSIKALCDKLLDTMPNGPNEVVIDNLLEKAIQIKTYK